MEVIALCVAMLAVLLRHRDGGSAAAEVRREEGRERELIVEWSGLNFKEGG